LDEQTVREVAHLARLHVSDHEVTLYSRQLSRVLEYMRQLNEVNTDNVPPTAHPLAVRNVLRPDLVMESLPPELALRPAPDPRDGFFRVPKVLDHDDV